MLRNRFIHLFLYDRTLIRWIWAIRRTSSWLSQAISRVTAFSVLCTLLRVLSLSLFVQRSRQTFRARFISRPSCERHRFLVLGEERKRRNCDHSFLLSVCFCFVTRTMTNHFQHAEHMRSGADQPLPLSLRLRKEFMSFPLFACFGVCFVLLNSLVFMWCKVLFYIFSCFFFLICHFS